MVIASRAAVENKIICMLTGWTPLLPTRDDQRY